MIKGDSYAILLSSAHGYKEETADEKQLKPVAVHKGSILTYLDPLIVNKFNTKYDRLVNYKLDGYRLPEVFLFATGSSVSTVTKSQRDLLLGIKHSHCRLEVLGRLGLVESLSVGSGVCVTIATIPDPVKGIVRHIGKLPGEEGIKFGIELLERRGQGTHDGHFKGHKYFKCDKDCAVFVAMDKIASCETAQLSETSDPIVLNPPLDDKTSIRICDLVTFVNKHRKPIKGIVRNICTDMPNGTFAEIEIENKLCPSDIPHAINVSKDKQYFSSKQSRIFLPISLIKRQTSRNSSTISGGKSASAENVDMATTESKFSNPHNFVVGSKVQYLNFEWYGIIRWIGTTPGDKMVYAGVEMDDDATDFMGSDGTWKNKIYFFCKPGRAKFAVLSSFKPDERSATLGSPGNVDHSQVKQTVASKTPPVDLNPYGLKVGSVVQYGDSEETKPSPCGVIKWIGILPTDIEWQAGVEMDDDVEDPHDGEWEGTEYFECRPNRGIFVHLTALKPGRRMETMPGSNSICVHNQTNNVSLKGSNEPNTSEHPSFMRQQSSHSSMSLQVDQNPYKLGEGSTIQCGDPAEYGVIKWMGILPERGNVLYAGVEFEQVVLHYNDGLHEGKQYFESRPGRGKFVKLLELHPDKRFVDTSTPERAIHVGSNGQGDDPKEGGKVEFPTGGHHQCAEVQKEDTKEIEHVSLSEIQVDLTAVKLEQPRDKPTEFNPYMLEVGSTVEFGDPVQYGVIRKIVRDNHSIEIAAEIEIDDHGYKAMPLVELRPDNRFNVGHVKEGNETKNLDEKATKPAEYNPYMLDVGSTVEFGDPVQHGVIKKVVSDDHSRSRYAEIEIDDHEYKAMPLVELRPDSRFNVAHTEEKAPKSQKTVPQLEVGSMIQFGDPAQYGVIKKIEMAVNASEELAAVELENGGHKVVPFVNLEPDNRFIVDVNNTEGQINPLKDELYVHEELLPVPPDIKFDKNKHTNVKGIQGNLNSCYLDATMYGMFSFSDAFDVLFLEDITTNAEEHSLQQMLKSKIVFPLRMKGIVVQDSVEEFRERLAKLQDIKGLTSDEKDPEEFLNILFKHVFRLDPFITIRRPSGIDEEFFVQLFVEPDENRPVIDTQKLLLKMFREQNINFSEYPTRLLLQMPRYGKRFKTFQRVIPSKELDVTALCKATGKCSSCNQFIGYICNECSEKNHEKFYCMECSSRHHHKVDQNEFDTGRLQLLSVLCIETSHYVCFTRITGSGDDEWVFFDSMADRQDNGYNLPKVTHCTSEMQEYVYGWRDISRIPSRDLPELVRRFVEDAYLCIYVDHDGVMYR